jgi:gamma-glutamyltranspeptidase
VSVAVAAPHPAALAAARHAVTAGGGAVDAAVAAAVALTVVYPHQCSLGGDLVALVRRPSGQVDAVLSIGAAAASVARVEAEGPHSVTVPGVVAGWSALGAARLPAALRYAAGLAEDGCPVSAGLARAIADREKAILADPGLRVLLTRDDRPLREGELMRQPRLAQSLRSLAENPRAFYSGPVGDALVAFLRRAGSRLSRSDFAGHEAEATGPLAVEADGVRWYAAPPPSQGATALAILAGTGAGDLIERSRRACAARDRLLGDPRGGPVDLPGLLRPVGEGGCAEVPPAAGDTVAITAVDDGGWAITLIQSVYQSFGAGLCDPATGIVLHNRASAFSRSDGHPARFGPGLRPPHTLCPLIGDGPGMLLAVGCQGGRAQAQILGQVAPALLGEDLAAVLARPRWAFGGRELGFATETLLAEPGAPTTTSLPVHVTAGRHDDVGHVQAARWSAGRLTAAADPRADGQGAII